MNIRAYLWPFIILLVMAFLHISAALYTNAYMDFWWYDVLLHFIGGLWVASTFFWLYYEGGFAKKPKYTLANFFLFTLGATIVVGIAWEIFEYIFGLTYILPGESYSIDTICDMGMDIIGSLCVYLFYRLYFWRKFK